MQTTGRPENSRLERFQRNIALEGVGESGQHKLRNSRVLVVGLGGLGSPALFYLAAAGVGCLGMADCDVVEPSNLQRQILHTEADLGRLKTESARDRIEQLDRRIEIESISRKVTVGNAAEIITHYDFVIEATDNFTAKFLINDCCVALRKPFSHGGVVGMFGQSLTYVPNQGPCFRCIFQETPEEGEVAGVDESGVLGSVAGIIGCIQATEAIKYLLGLGELLTARILSFDGATSRFREVALAAEQRCSVCKPPKC